MNPAIIDFLFDNILILAETDAAVDTTNQTTYTFSTKSFGAADANRQIIVSIAGFHSADARSISTVTIGGVSATINVQETHTISGSRQSGIAIANVPTGTTGNVVVTWDNTMTSCAIVVYRTVGASTTAHDTATDPGAASGVVTGTLDIPSGGIAVAVVAWKGSASPPMTTWTVATETEDTTVENNETYSSATHNVSGSGITITATASVTLDQNGAALSIASYTPG